MADADLKPISREKRRSGRMIVARATPVLTIGLIGSNIIGAVILFVLMAWVIPVPTVEDPDRLRVINVIALSTYVTLAVISGTVRTLRDVLPVRRWLLDERPPTAREQTIALLAPSRLARRLVTHWGLGIILFTVINGIFVPRLALVIFIASVFSAMGTVSFSYLLAERGTREVARRALEDGPQTTPAVPGVSARIMATWALATGMPVLGVVLIAAGVTLGILPDDTEKQRLATMVICGVALFVGVQAMFLVARSISDPIKSMRMGIDRVAAGDLAIEVPVYDASEVGQLQSGFNDMVEGLRERERVRDLFGRHVGQEVAEQALLVGAELGGEVRDVAVIFVDIVGSTTMATELPPHEVVEVLNRFFAVVVETVDRNGGSVNKFEGDAALCVFGAPLERFDAAGDALTSAREMSEGLARELPELGVGIGVSAGPVVAGNVGAASRHEFTVIGDPVNEAARLTEIAKSIEGGVVASGAVFERAREAEQANWEHHGSTVLRGRSEETKLVVPV
jgi:adenylate cyclase